MPEHPLLNFFDQLKIDNTYELFFPKKEQGLVIIWLYEKIKNKTFPNGIFKEAGKKLKGIPGITTTATSWLYRNFS